MYRPTFGARFPMRLFSSLSHLTIISFIYYVNRPMCELTKSGALESEHQMWDGTWMIT